jgi:peptide deformylase
VLFRSVDGQTRSCFNPEIVTNSPTLSDFDEGCLSFPGGSCTIKRPDAVTVKYQDAHGAWTHAVLQGLEARCFQHELDHLNGKTMYDRQKEQHAEQS